MKKIIVSSIVALIMVAFAASSAPGGEYKASTTQSELGYNYWSGEGSGAWQRFEIYYYPDTKAFEGKWWYDDTHYGWIKGEAYEDIGNVGVKGKGRFGDDYAGAWDGIFYFRGECFGKTWAKSYPPGDGEFRGI